MYGKIPVIPPFSLHQRPRLLYPYIKYTPTLGIGIYSIQVKSARALYLLTRCLLVKCHKFF